MADLGDVSTRRGVATHARALSTATAAWGNASSARGTPPIAAAGSEWAMNLAGVAADVPTNGLVVVMYGPIVIDIVMGSGGHALVHDLTNGQYMAHRLDGTAVWIITVSGASATVTPTFEAYPTILAGDRLVVIAGDGKLKTRPPADDAYWGQVASLLHFDGADGSVTTDNEAETAWTLYSGAALSTSGSRFGASSLLLDGVNNYAASASSALHTLTTAAAWTVEGFVRLDNVLPLAGFFYNGDVGDNTHRIQIGTNGSGAVTLYLQAGTGTGVSVTSTVVLSDGEWHHIAATRIGDTIRLFIDGELCASGTFTALMSARTVCYLGRFRSGGASVFMAGRLDEWRITYGVCRYYNTFQPPHAPFPNQ